MSFITFSENHESELISFEDGQALASLSNPRGEALKWVYSLGHLPAPHVVILGLGSGFQVEALADLSPDVTITIVESRPSLVPVFRAQFPDLAERVHIIIAESSNELMGTELFREMAAGQSYVVSFQECWGDQRQLFTDFFAHLTGRSVESVQYHFQDLGINMKALYLDQNKLISIKEFMPVVEASATAEKNKQIFRTLGELVK
jgi:Spermidine synthase